MRVVLPVAEYKANAAAIEGNFKPSDYEPMLALVKYGLTYNQALATLAVVVLARIEYNTYARVSDMDLVLLILKALQYAR